MTRGGSDADVDVLVVGCGSVGGVLAAFLGVHGAGVVVIDPRDEPYPQPRAATLDPEVMRILARVPGLADVGAWAVGVRRSRVLGPARPPLFTVHTPDGALGPPQGALLNQPRLEAALRAGTRVPCRPSSGRGSVAASVTPRTSPGDLPRSRWGSTTNDCSTVRAGTAPRRAGDDHDGAHRVRQRPAYLAGRRIG